jgi:hypothetical protein
MHISLTLKQLTGFPYVVYSHTVHSQTHKHIIIFVADFSVQIHVRRSRMNLNYTSNILQRPQSQSRGWIRPGKVLIPPVIQVSFHAFISLQIPCTRIQRFVTYYPQTEIFRVAAILFNTFFKYPTFAYNLHVLSIRHWQGTTPSPRSVSHRSLANRLT